MRTLESDKYQNSLKQSMTVAKKTPLLILECDKNRLKSEFKDIGEQLNLYIAAATQKHPVLISATLYRDMKYKIENLIHSRIRFNYIFVIAHSDEKNIRVAGDKCVDWMNFARLIAPLKPRHMIFVACHAGKSRYALFGNIPTLDQIDAPLNRIYRDDTFVLEILQALELQDNPDFDLSKWFYRKAIGWLKKAVFNTYTRLDYLKEVIRIRKHWAYQIYKAFTILAMILSLSSSLAFT